MKTDGDANGSTLDLLVTLHSDPDLDPEVAERRLRQLRRELAELDVESVRPAEGGLVPDGAKGADPVTVGAIVVALSASGGVFTAVIETIRDWLGRRADGNRISVTIDGDTLELNAASADQRQELIDVFVREHSRA